MKKGFVIDTIILILLGFLLMIGIYFLYELLPNLSRLVALLIILIMIPIFWGSIYLSLKNKNTIGNIIEKRMNNEKRKDV